MTDLSILEVDRLDYYKTNPLGQEIVRIGVAADGSCLLHAYLRGFAEEYINDSQQERARKVCQLRQQLAKSLEFQQLFPWDPQLYSPETGAEYICDILCQPGVSLTTEPLAYLVKKFGIKAWVYDVLYGRWINSDFGEDLQGPGVVIASMGNHFETLGIVERVTVPQNSPMATVKVRTVFERRPTII